MAGASLNIGGRSVGGFYTAAETVPQLGCPESNSADPRLDSPLAWIVHGVSFPLAVMFVAIDQPDGRLN